MQVWLVYFSTGEYKDRNDYAVAAFDSKEKADKYTEDKNNILIDFQLHFNNFVYTYDETIIERLATNGIKDYILMGGAEYFVSSPLELQ